MRLIKTMFTQEINHTRRGEHDQYFGMEQIFDELYLYSRNDSLSFRGLGGMEIDQAVACNEH